MIHKKLEAIEFLAEQCDEETALELNRRLQEILDWVIDKSYRRPELDNFT